MKQLFEINVDIAMPLALRLAGGEALGARMPQPPNVTDWVHTSFRYTIDSKTAT